MWQEILVYLIIALGACLTLWRFYAKFTGQDACCGGGPACKADGQGGRKVGCGCGKAPDRDRRNCSEAG